MRQHGGPMAPKKKQKKTLITFDSMQHICAGMIDLGLGIQSDETNDAYFICDL